MKSMSDVNSFCTQIDTRLKELESKDYIVKTAFGISTTGSSLPLIDYAFKTIDEAIKACREIDSRLQEVENFRNPLTIARKVQMQFEMIEGLTNQVALVLQKMSALDFDDRFLVMYSEEDIADLYKSSGLTIPIVKKFYETKLNSGVEVTSQTIYNYVTGKIPDLKVRSVLGNYFKQAAVQKAKNQTASR